MDRHEVDEDREWVEERAAIMEFDGGLPRAEAERAARRALARRLDDRRAERALRAAEADRRS